MIDVHIEMNAAGLTDPILTAVCDAFSDLEPVCPDMLEWSVGAALTENKIEFDITIASEDAGKAIERANELIWMAVRYTGGGFNAAVTEKVSAEKLVDA